MNLLTHKRKNRNNKYFQHEINLEDREEDEMKPNGKPPITLIINLQELSMEERGFKTLKISPNVATVNANPETNSV